MNPSPKKSKRIMVVDDDNRLRDQLRRFFVQEGFEVHVANGGIEMDRLLLRNTYDLIVLDFMMPQETGLSILSRLREAKNTTSIIMLTAKGNENDRIQGLESGADDYLPKPFNPRELLARVQAVLRRCPVVENPGAPTIENETISFGPFVLDLAHRKLSKSGEDLPLTTGEFAMLKTLVRHPRQTLSRDKLSQMARGREFDAYNRSLDVQISRLRRVIEVDPSNPQFIQTVWGLGYVFIPDGSQ